MAINQSQMSKWKKQKFKYKLKTIIFYFIFMFYKERKNVLAYKKKTKTGQISDSIEQKKTLK